MTDGTANDLSDLTERLAVLEEENARLRAETDSAASSAHSPGAMKWRAWVSALCIVIATILVPESIVASWARVQLVDEERFVATLAPLASDPAIQEMIIDETMDAITAQVDFAGLTASVVDGVASLDIPPAAVSALRLLEQPAADGLKSVVNRAVTTVVESDAFAEVWTTATRGAHRALTLTATSDGGGLVVRTTDGVGVQLGAIVDRVRQTLADQGVGAAALIPSVDRVVVIGTGESLMLIRTAYTVTTVVGTWLPLVSLALFALGIFIARRRSTALIGAGIGLFIGGGSLAVGISVGTITMSAVAAQTDLSPSALGAVYGQISGDMSHTATMIAVIGLVVAVLGWASGRSRSATALRGSLGSINAGLRGRLHARGVDTGRVGRWLYAQRALVRGLIAVLAVLWLLALRPLGLGDIVLVIVVALVVWWLAELAQRRPDEAIVTVQDDDASVGADH